MFCRYCGTLLKKNKTECPACGKENAPEVIVGEEKRLLTKKQLKIVLLCILAVAILIPAVYFGVKGIQKLTKPNDVYYKDNYCLSKYDMVGKKDTVIATMDGYTLTNGQLQIFYWARVYELANSGYSSYYGLNIKKPLNEQIYDAQTGMTWQQMFLEQALADWENYVTMSKRGKEINFELPKKYQDSIDNLYEELTQYAKDAKLETAEQYLDSYVCPNCTFEEYKYYHELYAYGAAYYEHLRENLELTDEEIEDYFKKNEATLKSSYGITKESGKLAAVRHILVMIDENFSSSKTYTDDEWEACRKAAQEIYDQWLAGEKTEESFAALAVEHSEDGGSASNGGLYNYFAKGKMVKNFNDWSFDESRVYGDHELIKTEYGYHIMFFVDAEEGWIVYTRSGLEAEKLDTMIKEWTEAAKADVNYKQINMVLANLG